MFRKLLRIAQVANDISSQIPTKQDSAWGATVKVLGIANSVYTTVHGRLSPMDQFVKDHDLESHSSAFFTQLFDDLDLPQLFPTRRLSFDSSYVASRLDEYAIDGSFLYLMSYESGGRAVQRASLFYHTQGFNFDLLFDHVWAKYVHGLRVEAETGHLIPSHEVCLKFSEVNLFSDVTSKKAINDLTRFAVHHDAFVARGKHRSYLLVGPPGTGKTSFVLQFAALRSMRVLHVDGSLIVRTGTAGFELLLDMLKPGLVLIDDIDRTSMRDGLAAVLFMLANAKTRHPKMPIFLTCNHPEVLELAVVRSGRIDEPIFFDYPDSEECKDIIKTYCPELSDALVSQITSEMPGMSHADIAEVAQRLQHLEPPEVFSFIEKRKRLNGLCKGVPRVSNENMMVKCD